MTSPSAPYGLLDTPTFPFPALAALVRRLPLGGARESALACLLCARLAHGTMPPFRLATAARTARADATAAWLGALPLAGDLHAATRALCAATATVPPSAPLDALTHRMLAQADTHLDDASRAELRALAERLAAEPT